MSTAENPPEKLSLPERLLGKKPKKLIESHKELRFTRSRQATQFFIISILFAMLTVSGVGAMFSKWGPNDPDFIRYVWFCGLPLIPAYIALRIALHCIRHAYILLTPMGVEVFPFFKPEKNLSVLFWSEIDSTDCTERLLTIHLNAEKTSGSVISLKPIAQAQISLLRKAIEARTTSQKSSI